MRPLFLLLLLIGCQTISEHSFDRSEFDQALTNGQSAQQAFQRSLNFVQGWLPYADPETGLIPRNIFADSTLWNAKDAAADNYPFMVLTTALLDSALFHNEMKQILANETRLSSRLQSLPDAYSFLKDDFLETRPDTSQILFGASEYMKDGLMPLTEWLGPSPWFDRMKQMLQDLYPLRHQIDGITGGNLGNAPVEEVNGELLQVLSRFYWITGDDFYLDWAREIGDYYLLENHLPRTYIRLRDHGCEFISGLSELYYTVSQADPNRKTQYQPVLHQFLDEILAQGRNPDGLFYNAINLETGEVVDSALADTWGYTLNAYYTIYLVDQKQEYQKAVFKLLQNIDKYRNYPWEGKSSDGYADAIESAINLYNREPLPSVADWIDSEIKVMWQKQQPNGIIEGWHGDGNFARTSIMYALWKTQGATLKPWHQDLCYGAVQSGDTLFISMTSAEHYHGTLKLDQPRHRSFLNLELDYPRINQFSEWYTVDQDQNIRLFRQDGSQLFNIMAANGISVHLEANDTLKIMVVKTPE
ncbi:MAG: hypothetical protein ACNS62_10000 [Candidatus Cyclobacteriaceae bacterium M3_2C_046]